MASILAGQTALTETSGEIRKALLTVESKQDALASDVKSSIGIVHAKLDGLQTGHDKLQANYNELQAALAALSTRQSEVEASVVSASVAVPRRPPWNSEVDENIDDVEEMIEDTEDPTSSNCWSVAGSKKRRASAPPKPKYAPAPSAAQTATMAAAVAADKMSEQDDKIARSITLGPWGDDLKTQDRIKPTLELLDHIRESTGNAMPTESVIAPKKYGDGSVIRFVKRADAVQFRIAFWSKDRFNLHAAKLHCSAKMSPSHKKMTYFTKELSEKVKTLILECSPFVRGLDIDDDRRFGGGIWKS